MFKEGYRDTSLDKGTGPVQGGVQRVQPCTRGGGGGCTGLHRGTGLYGSAGLYREGYKGTSLDRGTGQYWGGGVYRTVQGYRLVQGCKGNGVYREG